MQARLKAQQEAEAKAKQEAAAKAKQKQAPAAKLPSAKPMAAASKPVESAQSLPQKKATPPVPQVNPAEAAKRREEGRDCFLHFFFRVGVCVALNIGYQHNDALSPQCGLCT